MSTQPSKFRTFAHGHCSDFASLWVSVAGQLVWLAPTTTTGHDLGVYKGSIWSRCPSCRTSDCQVARRAWVTSWVRLRALLLLCRIVFSQDRLGALCVGIVHGRTLTAGSTNRPNLPRFCCPQWRPPLPCVSEISRRPVSYLCSSHSMLKIQPEKMIKSRYHSLLYLFIMPRPSFIAFWSSGSVAVGVV